MDGSSTNEDQPFQRGAIAVPGFFVFRSAVGFGKHASRNLFRDLGRPSAQAEASTLAFVPFARAARRFASPHSASGDAGDIVRGDGHAGSGPAAHTTPVSVLRLAPLRQRDRHVPYPAARRRSAELHDLAARALTASRAISPTR